NQVARLQEVVVPTEVAPEGRLRLAELLTETDQLASPREHVVTAVRATRAPVAAGEDAGERRPLSNPACDLDRLADELGAAVVVRGEGELDGEDGEQTGAQGAVGWIEASHGLLGEVDDLLVHPAESGGHPLRVQSQDALGEPSRVAGRRRAGGCGKQHRPVVRVAGVVKDVSQRGLE